MASRPPQDHRKVAPFPETITMAPIGRVHSPYLERHGTPRQATVTKGTRTGETEPAHIEVFPKAIPREALKDLDGFDYIWVLAYLHLNRHWNAQVVPPRGPKVKRGLLATRAPHRPNMIGLSALKLLRVETNRVYVEGIDLLDGTPVLDIKPYIPYADAFPDANSGWLDELDEAPDAPDWRRGR